eukprot:951275_1
MYNFTAMTSMWFVLYLFFEVSHCAKVTEIDGPDGWPMFFLIPEGIPANLSRAHPTKFPTTTSTYSPTQSPTVSPSKYPSLSPTTHAPTEIPTSKPTMRPTHKPTVSPSKPPSSSPSKSPTPKPTKYPTTSKPSMSPTRDDDIVLDEIITRNARHRSKDTRIKLYAAESFYIMDDLEKDLWMRGDDAADLFIFRNVNKPFSSKPFASYFSTI